MNFPAEKVYEGLSVNAKKRKVKSTAATGTKARAALRRCESTKETAGNTPTLSTVIEIYRTLNSTLESGKILYFTAKSLAEIMDLVRCSFISLEPEKGIGRVMACKDDPNIHDLVIKLKNYPEITKVMNTGEPVIITDVGQDPIMSKVSELTEGIRDHSIMTLPLSVQGRTLGVLQIRKKGKPKGFNNNEIEFCRIVASSAAIAFKNAQLYKDLENRNY